MRQENFIVECLVNQSGNLFIIRVPNGAVVKYTDDVRQLCDFFDEVCYKNRDSEGK